MIADNHEGKFGQMLVVHSFFIRWMVYWSIYREAVVNRLLVHHLRRTGIMPLCAYFCTIITGVTSTINNIEVVCMYKLVACVHSDTLTNIKSLDGQRVRKAVRDGAR